MQNTMDYNHKRKLHETESSNYKEKENSDGIDFHVRDENGDEWVILNCL